MSLFERLLGPATDDHAAERSLWRAVVGAAREPRWYAELGVADSVAGRFDMVTMILALVLLRLEREPGGSPASVRLTELFVEDMDAQLRQSGVGDLVVGKHVGKLMAALGGRLGALREALDGDGLEEAVRRNVTMADDTRIPALAEALRQRHREIAVVDAEALLGGRLAR